MPVSAIPAAARLIRWRCIPVCGFCRGVVRRSGTGCAFRALGGAFSIDHAACTPGYDVFPVEEVPSYADAQRAINAGPADVLLLPRLSPRSAIS